MPKTIRHILKADEIRLEEPLRLSLDPTATPSCETSRSASAAASVRIVQNHPDYAVIEVTCACGKTTSIRCDYAAATPSPARLEPAQG